MAEPSRIVTRSARVPRSGGSRSRFWKSVPSQLGVPALTRVFEVSCIPHEGDAVHFAVLTCGTLVAPGIGIPTPATEDRRFARGPWDMEAPSVALTIAFETGGGAVSPPGAEGPRPPIGTPSSSSRRERRLGWWRRPARLA